MPFSCRARSSGVRLAKTTPCWSPHVIQPRCSTAATTVVLRTASSFGIQYPHADHREAYESVHKSVHSPLRRTGRTTLGRLKVAPFIGERVINHSKDVLEETYDLWDYFDEKRGALERLENYLVQLRDNKVPGAARKAKHAPRTHRHASSRAMGSRNLSAPRVTR